MNKFLTMGIGGLIGAGIGFVIANILIEQFMPEEELNSDVIEADEVNNDWHPEEIDAGKPEKEEKRKKAHTDYSKIFIPSEEGKPDLAKLAQRYNDGVVPEEEEPKIEDLVEPDDSNISPTPDQPYLIKGDAWVQNHWKFRQVELIYYSGDDILTTDTGAPLNDPESIIGPDALTSFDDEEYVYVCNEALESIYSIRRLESIFYKERDVRTKRRKPAKPKEEE